MYLVIAVLVFQPDPELPSLDFLSLLPSKARVDEQKKAFDDFCAGFTNRQLIQMYDAPWGCWYWEQLSHAHCHRYPYRLRQEYLGKLRDALGWEQFLRGELPPAVPLCLIPAPVATLP